MHMLLTMALTWSSGMEPHTIIMVITYNTTIMVVTITTHIIIIIHGGTTDIETLSTFIEDIITGLRPITDLMQQGMGISAEEGEF